jgi:hypothetical protein
MSVPAPITATLGIDQAARSGWGIARIGDALSRIQHGVARTHVERRAVVQLALELAGGDPRQLLVMFESHAGMPLTRLTRHDRATARQGRLGAPERSTASILGQGAAKGRWDELLDMLGHPERLRDDVEPRTWRARVLGTARGDTETLKHLARTWASTTLGEAIEDPDEAEGVAICAFAVHDGVARLEARRRDARLYARGRREEQKQLELGGALRAKEAAR